MLEEQKINKARRKWQKQSEFLCTIKFRNTLPDPPLGPHFLEVPLDLDKYTKYTPTTLEQNYKWKVTVTPPWKALRGGDRGLDGRQQRVGSRAWGKALFPVPRIE